MFPMHTLAKKPLTKLLLIWGIENEETLLFILVTKVFLAVMPKSSPA
jgi:hypothetical protein